MPQAAPPSGHFYAATGFGAASMAVPRFSSFDALDAKALPAASFSQLPPVEKNVRGTHAGVGFVCMIICNTCTHALLPTHTLQFYIEHPAVTARSDQQVEAYRHDKAVRCVIRRMVALTTSAEQRN